MSVFFCFFSFFGSTKSSKCVSTPITFGNPWTCNTFKNSNVSISNPYEPSTKSNTRSAIFAASTISFRSFLTSMNCIRRFFPLTTVIGPFTSLSACRV